MRGRIAALLKLPSASTLNIMTFHSFALRLLRNNPNVAGLPERFQLWDASAQRRVFTERRMWWNEEDDILDIISGAKERLLDAEAFAATIDNTNAVMVEALRYFRLYQRVLRDAGAIDFADMISFVVKAMNDDDTYRDSVTGSYDHMLVDEYQDVNPGQIKLIEHFVSAGVSLWAVGDDDQTLYSFRASDIRYILDFTKTYPKASIHVLTRNYRSSPNLVRAAKCLIRNNRDRIDKDYQPVLTKTGELVIRGYPNPEIEARQVAHAIAELLSRGDAAANIAVLYRASALGLSFQSALKESEIPFEIRGGGDLWESIAAKLVVGALVYLRDGESADAMSLLGGNRRSEIVREQLDEVRTVVRNQYQSSCQKVNQIVGDAVPALYSMRQRSEWRGVVDAVSALALSSPTLEEFRDKIMKQTRSLRIPPKNAVVLSTIHSAKGLEWDTVFMVGIEDGLLPHVNANDIQEERRVAYVGMTRASRRLGLTYAAERYGERSQPSRFLFEIAETKPRHHSWTGPRAKDAEHRLPLRITSSARRRIK